MAVRLEVSRAIRDQVTVSNNVVQLIEALAEQRNLPGEHGLAARAFRERLQNMIGGSRGLAVIAVPAGGFFRADGVERDPAGVRNLDHVAQRTFARIVLAV